MKKIFIVVLVLALSGLIFFYQAEFFQLVENIEKEKDTNPLAAAGLLVMLKTVTAPLGFPGTPLTLLTGSLFGYFFGTIIALVGNTLGACLAFLLSRYVLRDYVQKKILSRYPKIKSYEQRVTKQGMKTVMVLRLIPLFPFNALNFLLGITNISFRNYAIGSFIGMIPGTFLFVYFGESLRMMRVTNIILAIVGIAILIYLGKIYERKIEKI